MSARRPFTVLHFVAAETDRGGILSMVRAMASAGLGRSVVAVSPSFLQERLPVFKVWRGAAITPEAITLRTLLEAAYLAGRLRAGLARRARIFHGHSRAGLLVALWLWLAGFDRVVVTVHCHGRQRWFYRLAGFLLGDRLLWLTPVMKRYYDVGSGDWAGCLPNFLPMGIRPPSSRRQSGTDRLRLGGIGTRVRWKGWHLLVEALGQLAPAERVRVEFHHIGSGDGSADSNRYKEELEVRIAELGMTAQFHWRGEAPSSAPLLAEVDLLVIPSDQEPFGLGGLEAWSAGVPVLAARGGGLAAMLVVGRDGWLFDNGSASSLARALADLLHSKAYRTAHPVPPQSEPVVANWRRRYQSFFDGTEPVI